MLDVFRGNGDRVAHLCAAAQLLIFTQRNHDRQASANQTFRRGRTASDRAPSALPRIQTTRVLSPVRGQTPESWLGQCRQPDGKDSKTRSPATKDEIVKLRWSGVSAPAGGSTADFWLRFSTAHSFGIVQRRAGMHPKAKDGRADFFSWDADVPSA